MFRLIGDVTDQPVAVFVAASRMKRWSVLVEWVTEDMRISEKPVTVPLTDTAKVLPLAVTDAGAAVTVGRPAANR